MSDKKNRNESFTNEDTIVRRAWIHSALESVRDRLKTAYPDPATAGTGVDGEDDDVEQSAGAAGPRDTDADRPRLYVVWSSPERRSGT